MKTQLKFSLQRFGIVLFQQILKLMVVVIVATLLLWIMGSFVAWDTNFHHWFLLEYRWGRSIVALLECFFILKVFKATPLDTMFPPVADIHPHNPPASDLFTHIQNTKHVL